MAEAGRGRFLQLPRRADQQPGTRSLPAPRHDPLATHASTAKPKGRYHVGPDRSPGGGVAPQAPYPTPLAKRPLRRQTPEVGAVCIMWRRWICGADLGDRRLERLTGSWTPHNNPVDFVETHLAVGRSAASNEETVTNAWRVTRCSRTRSYRANSADQGLARDPPVAYCLQTACGC